MSPATTEHAPILVMAPNWLGDLIMSTPVFDRLEREGRPVHALIREPWLPLLENDPRIDALLPYDRDGRHAGVRGSLRLAGELRGRGYATVYVLPPSFRAAAVAALAGIPERIGWTGDGRGLLLSSPRPRARRGDRHYCEEILALAGADDPDDGLPVEPSLPSSSSWPSSNPAGESKTIALAVGATYGDAKSWPPARAAAFADACAARGERVVVLGDAAARSHARALGEHLRSGWTAADATGPGVVDLVGATGLLEVAVLLRDSHAFVGNDSGLMHLAAALGTPTVGLFGSTNPAWTSPRGPRASYLGVTGFTCSPCHLRECPEPSFCLDTLSPSAVLDAVDRLVGGGVS